MAKFFSLAPGALWAAIIVALTLLATWLSEYFGGLPWVPPLAGFLAAVLVPVLKVLAENRLEGPPVGASFGARAAMPSLFRRWLL